MSSIVSYEDFLQAKLHCNDRHGFDPIWIPDFLFDFQQHLVDWAIRQGRAAIFADCGLGKTPMQLVWAQNVAQHTNDNVLLLTPLAVSTQTAREAEKFGIEARVSRDGTVYRGITVTNYEQLEKFSPQDFVGVVCDESSILKNYAGATRNAIIKFASRLNYRLLCTATPSPNDYTELGNSCEALGAMRRVHMLANYFTHDSANTSQWRLKGHGQKKFWQFVASWARALRRPADLGFDDGDFVLPELQIQQRTLNSPIPDGYLFPVERLTLKEQRDERRETIHQRCEMVAEIANANPGAFVAWCSLNNESNLLAQLIDDCIEITGSDSAEDKESKTIAFSNGEIKALVTKPDICGFGMNWQHCHRTSFFPSHSHEQFYQAVRRFWRFGQQKDVSVFMITTEAENRVVENMRRKEQQANALFDEVVNHMKGLYSQKRALYQPQSQLELPAWL